MLQPLTDEEDKLKALYRRPLNAKEQSFLLGIQFGRGEISLEAYLSGMAEINNGKES